MKKIILKVIDCRKNKEFLCMFEDAKLLLNMLEQAYGAEFKDSDYIQPGILAGQTKMDIIRINAQNILNHIDNLDRRHEFFF